MDFFKYYIYHILLVQDSFSQTKTYIEPENLRPLKAVEATFFTASRAFNPATFAGSLCHILGRVWSMSSREVIADWCGQIT